MSNSIGDLNNSGLKGNNWPWQYRVLLGLQEIDNNTDQVEFLLQSILTALQGSTDYEAKFVIDTCDSNKVYLEVRIWDPTPPPGTWGPITYYLPGSSTPVTPVGASTPGCLQYGDTGSILAQILAELQTQTTVLNDIEANTDGLETTLSSILTELQSTLDVNITNATLAVTQSGSWTVTSNQGTNPWVISGTVALDAATLSALETITVQQGTNPWTVDGTVNAAQSGTWTVALDAATLLALETITVNQGTSPWVVSGTVTATPSGTQDVNIVSTIAVPVTDNGGSLTVDATALDIRPLDCSTDSIKICDGTTDLGINLDGSINTQSSTLDGSGTPITSLTFGSRTGLDVNILPPNVGVALDSLVETGVTGDLSLFSGSITSITFQNIGSAVATVSVNGGSTYFPVAPGTSINLDPRIPMGYYDGTSFFWDTTTPGASLLIIYNYI